ncbi:MAG: KTSC domain-containing protein [Pyrinomonadaceae bacterium]|nr:KTSC domain-containing protein [Pyrinomonadaceae bacterium]
MKELEIKNSSNLKKATFDDQTNELVVEFRNGTKYKYFDVPNEIFNEFAKTVNEDGSAGKFFNANIKSYRFEKVED